VAMLFAVAIAQIAWCDATAHRQTQTDAAVVAPMPMPATHRKLTQVAAAPAARASSSSSDEDEEDVDESASSAVTRAVSPIDAGPAGSSFLSTWMATKTAADSDSAADPTPSQTCGTTVRPTFCTNVNWNVDNTVVTNNIASEADMVVELMVINFKGTRACQRWLTDLQCRYTWPDCALGPPCKWECEKFVAQCQGGIQSCNAYPTTGCKSAATTAAAPLHALTAVTLTVAALLLTARLWH